MFEGFTLEQQRVIEAQRGWKPTYSALTYCTAEAVVFRNVRPNLLETEVAIGVRKSGAPDCLGKTQSKWGGYTKPSDPDPMRTMQRVLKETFDWNADQMRLQLAGIVGPWIYKSTLVIGEGGIVLTVSDTQAESTPFQATLFAAMVSCGCELGQGTHTKSTQDARWITVGELIQQEGRNLDHLYWEMLFVCLRALSLPPSGNDLIVCHPPGQYVLCL